MKTEEQVMLVVAFATAATMLIVWLNGEKETPVIEDTPSQPYPQETQTCSVINRRIKYVSQPLASLQLAFNLFNDSCICGESFRYNCAHFLSDALMKAGYKIKNKEGMDVFNRCKQGRPTRAKELLEWAKFMREKNSGLKRLSHDAKHGHPKPIAAGFWFVYQENSSGQGHVCFHHETSETSYETRGRGGEYPDWPVQWHFSF